MLNNKALAASLSAGPKTYIEDVFSSWLYAGNGSTQTITNGIDLAGEGGLVWTKSRNTADGSRVFDTQSNSILSTSLSNSKLNGSFALQPTYASFTNGGFYIPNDFGGWNTNGTTYTSWTFRKAPKFFDVVTYTGTGSNRTVAHNLGSVPGCIIVKRTDTTGDWQVYHRSFANTEYLVLNSTAAKATGATRWNSTTPTSTEFSLGTDATVNASGATYVAYLFAHDAGGFGDSGNDNVISCGSFTTGSSASLVVNLGWEPQWVLLKSTNNTYDWWQYDNMRGAPINTAANILSPNTSSAEVPEGAAFTISNQGIQFTGNVSGLSFIYIAIRRGPMKTPTDATKVFAQSLQANDTTNYKNTFANQVFPPDWGLLKQVNLTSAGRAITRLTGNKFLQTTDTNSESDTSFLNGGTAFGETETGISIQSTTGNAGNVIIYSFRRAPGFFDVVAYTGDGSNGRNVPHNLMVTPEFAIVKRRDSSSNWVCGFNNTNGLLNSSVSFSSSTGSGSPAGNGYPLVPFFSSASTFYLGSGDSGITAVNTVTAPYIAYLFATCPGVSKVGSYTGTGTTLNVNCGFTNGARFVLIKRTDSTGDWFVWDTARGIISANDPYILLNSTAAEVTNTDYIDPLSSGFQISSTAPAAINASGGSYIYLSVA